MSIIANFLRQLRPPCQACRFAVRPLPIAFRFISMSSPRYGLEEFIDPNRAPNEPVIVGRGWTADELRRKSFEDLHKLWYVLYKERNLLLTEALYCRRYRANVPAPQRKRYVRKSMARIKLVVRERQIAAKKKAEAEAAAAAAAAPETAVTQGQALQTPKPEKKVDEKSQKKNIKSKPKKRKNRGTRAQRAWIERNQ